MPTPAFYRHLLSEPCAVEHVADLRKQHKEAAVYERRIAREETPFNAEPKPLQPLELPSKNYTKQEMLQLALNLLARHVSFQSASAQCAPELPSEFGAPRLAPRIEKLEKIKVDTHHFCAEIQRMIQFFTRPNPDTRTKVIAERYADDFPAAIERLEAEIANMDTSHLPGTVGHHLANEIGSIETAIREEQKRPGGPTI